MRGWRRFPFLFLRRLQVFLSPPSLLYLLRVIYAQCKGLERDILIIDVHHRRDIRNNRNLLSRSRRPVSGSILRLVPLAHEVDCIYDNGKARTLLAVLRLPLIEAKLSLNAAYLVSCRSQDINDFFESPRVGT